MVKILKWDRFRDFPTQNHIPCLEISCKKATYLSWTSQFNVLINQEIPNFEGTTSCLWLANQILDLIIILKMKGNKSDLIRNWSDLTFTKSPTLTLTYWFSCILRPLTLSMQAWESKSMSSTEIVRVVWPGYSYCFLWRTRWSPYVTVVERRLSRGQQGYMRATCLLVFRDESELPV